MENVLDVKNLSVVFGDESVIQNVSFALRRGEMTAIIGPNGGGKTTLLRAVLGLVLYEGRVERQPGISVGYVPQRFSIPASTPITVTEFFLLKADRFWMPRTGFLGVLARQLELVGLDQNIVSRLLGRLSSGQLQRPLVARALLNRPDVLLFDEPTAAVDVGFTETIYQIMRRLSEGHGTTILLISHDLNVVFRYAATVLCLNRRRLCHGLPRRH